MLRPLARPLPMLLAAFVLACGGEGLSGIKNLPPVAVAGADVTARVGELVSFDGSASSDPEGTIASFLWSFGDGATAATAAATHAFADAGVHKVTLTVADDLGLVSSDQRVVTVTLPDQPPVAVIAVSTNAAHVGDVVDFDGSGSTDDGLIGAWAWDFGDGTKAVDALAHHAYTAAGNYTVTLTVTDDAHQTGSATDHIRVQAVVPPPSSWPGDSTWIYGLDTPSQASDCGGFQAAPLTIHIDNAAAATSPCRITEAGGSGGSTVYTGSYTSATRAFTATNSGSVSVQTLQGSFDATFTHFTGGYFFQASLIFCTGGETRAISGHRTVPAP